MIEVLLAMLKSGWVEDVAPMLTLTRSLYGHSGLWTSFLAKEAGAARVLSAARHGNAARLTFLLHCGDFSSETSNGTSLSLLAGASGGTAVLAALHDFFSECLNCCDPDGNTPLHLASAAGHVDAVRFLITHSDDVTLNFRDAFGLTALHLAIHQGQAAVVGVLAGSTRVQLACGSEHALSLAVSMGKVECVQSLVRCERVLVTAVSAVGAAGMNILMRAAIVCPPALPVLLQAFSCPLLHKHKLPRVNDRDQEGRSALFYAAGASSPLAIHALCAAGASLKLLDRLGRTCLQFVPAGKPGSERCRELLLNLGAALPVRVPVAAGLPGGAASSASPAQAPASSSSSSSSSSNMQQDPNGYDSGSYESESEWEEQDAEL